MERFKAQAERFGTECIPFRNIKTIDTKKTPFVLHDEMGESYEAHAVIIATGARAKLLGLEKESAMMKAGQGVSACATCDGAFYPDKEVVVVGAGDTAMEEATFLTRFSKIMLERAEKNPKIEFKLWRTVQDILQAENGRIRGVVLEDPRDGSTEEVFCEGMFTAIGHAPNTEFLGEEFKRNEVGYLLLEDGTRTNIDGIFAAGDVHDPDYRQAITAAGMGCAAALEAQRWLEHKGLA
jgi:thioredoxin reductase (NADPH)